MVAFYRRHHCRMARIHLLTGCAVTLGRFCGVSAEFGAMGERFMPVTVDGVPRTEAWARYAAACEARRPIEVRDELWITAHMEDMEVVRAKGLDVAFYRACERNERDPMWRLLRQHMEMTMDARLIDHSALEGAIAGEAAMAQGMGLAIRRIVKAGWALLGRYARETAVAIALPARETRREWISYRKAGLVLLVTTVSSWSAAKVFRRGVRAKLRGRTVNHGDAWPLLAEVLGEKVAEVDPLVVAFYANPALFEVKASLELRTIPAKLWSWVLTRLVGQGLYETSEREFDARFRVFRRDDGSMHFVRELYCREQLRVFDSDFVVRKEGAAPVPTLYEVFPDHSIEVEMEVSPMPSGGLKIRGRNVYLRKVRLPRLPIKVEFRSTVLRDAPTGTETLAIDGHLLMQPDTRLGRFLMHTLLRRPEHLGCIHYRANRR